MSPTGNVCLTLVYWKKWGAWKKIVTSVFIESAPFATKIKGEKLVHQRSAYKKVITLLLRLKSSSGEVSQKIHDNDKCCCDNFFLLRIGKLKPELVFQDEASVAFGGGCPGLQDLRAVFRGRGLRWRHGLPPELVLRAPDHPRTHLKVLSRHQGIRFCQI